MQTCSAYNYVELLYEVRKNFNNNDSGNDYDDIEPPENQTLYETIEKIAPDENATISHAMWFSNRRQIDFKPIFTDEGRCFSFNAINSKEIYKDV